MHLDLLSIPQSGGKNVKTFRWSHIQRVVQYNGGFLLDILLLTQAPIFVWFGGTIRHVIRNVLIEVTRDIPLMYLFFSPTPDFLLW